MIELTDGEILLRPFTSSDKKQWRRVRAMNREWLEEWEATVPRTSKSDELKSALSFNKMVRAYRKEERAGRSFSFGIFIGPNLIGQINLGGVIYGALRGAHIGYWIDRNFANRGYTTQAVQLLSSYGFSELGLHRIEINVRLENAASCKVAEKAGFTFEGHRKAFLHIDGAWRDHVSFVKYNELIQ